jgi:hypothetical protein
LYRCLLRYVRNVCVRLGAPGMSSKPLAKTSRSAKAVEATERVNPNIIGLRPSLASAYM